ncbi:MAG: glycosyltransferase [Candidatus Thermoplasmatota archaeon]
MKITVLVTHLDDARVLRTLCSLIAQSRVPDAVLVADGGSRGDVLREIRAFAAEHPRIVRVEHHPGSVAETRDSALKSLRGVDIVAFLDADEVAPADWLRLLVAPIEGGEAAFSGGPTRPLAEPQGKGERYLNEFEAWFYPNVVAHDLSKLPMGNSAWRYDVLMSVGGIDPRLTWGGEDYDVNLRVAKAGHVGAYVHDAWTFHDQSGRNDLRRLLRRKYRYNVGATMAYLKNGVLREKMRGATRNTVAFKHPYERWNLVVQPLALARALTLRRKLLRK